MRILTNFYYNLNYLSRAKNQFTLKLPSYNLGETHNQFFFHRHNFLMSHFLQAVVLSAWTWHICLFAPCFLSLHSHSMTYVKRISSLRESSHSTRTKRVSRMAVIRTVSKLTDTHVFHAESRCRWHVGLMGTQTYSSFHHSLLSLFSVPFCWTTVGDVLAKMLISQQERSQVNVVHFGVTRPHMVILYDPVSLQRWFRFSLNQPTCYHHAAGSPCWLFSVWLETDLWLCSALLSLPPSLCLCCGCPPSSLSSIMALFGRPIGHPGDRWWWVWDKDIQ